MYIQWASLANTVGQRLVEASKEGQVKRVNETGSGGIAVHHEGGKIWIGHYAQLTLLHLTKFLSLDHFTYRLKVSEVFGTLK